MPRLDAEPRHKAASPRLHYALPVQRTTRVHASLVLGCTVSTYPPTTRPCLHDALPVSETHDPSLRRTTPLRGVQAVSWTGGASWRRGDAALGRDFFFFVGVNPIRVGRASVYKQRQHQSRTMGMCRTTQHGARQYVARVWTWISAIWTHLSGGQGPPLSAALLMADDQRHWQPGAQLQPLWTRLRIATLAALHSARVQRRKGIPTTATSVAARLVHQMRSAMLRDWQRVRGRNSLAALAEGVCCSTWLKGRQPFISLEQFQQHWGEQGALYQVSTGALYQPDATPQSTVLWTVQHPTPIPMGPGG